MSTIAKPMLRGRVIVITVLVLVPLAIAIWWDSPAAIQRRNMKAAAEWLQSVGSVLSDDARFAGLTFSVSTAEEIWISGTVSSAADLDALGQALEQLQPPCPIRTVNVFSPEGARVDPGYLFKPQQPDNS